MGVCHRANLGSDSHLSGDPAEQVRRTDPTESTEDLSHRLKRLSEELAALAVGGR
eukprot:NODE_17125_length_217_cov_73.993827.p2 GENE.NODE_17125_length_217_cov_73.993827~~NODE_17125_length_217_cov_73.993827.p2  ORF type:complete len:55 (-),score=9.99 NODE_17125_length_217_cov_73.993827:35-199(-)